MNDDDLRHALDAYAATAPDGDPRPGMRALLARRRKVRAASVAGVACLALLGVVTLHGAGPSAGLVSAGDPTTSPTPTGADPTPALPSATDTSAPGRTPDPSGPPAQPASTPAADPGDPRPVTATATGPDGLRVRVTLSARGPATARAVTADVTASDDDGSPYLAGADWGEGKPGRMVAIEDSCVHSNPLLPPISPTPTPSPQPGHLHDTEAHSWRHAGHYVVTFRVVSRVSCSGSDTTEDATVRLGVDVVPGDVASNGSAQPGADRLVPRLDGNEPRSVALQGEVSDPDGWVGSVTVDWGDGSKRETLTNGLDCDDGDGRRFPDGRLALDDLTHTYAKSGSYDVVLTFTSAGCDGKDVQHGRATTTAEV